MLRFVLAVALGMIGLLLAQHHARAAEFPSPDNSGYYQGFVPMCVQGNGTAVPCGTNGTSLAGSSGSSGSTAGACTPISLGNTVIATANTYQQIFSAGSIALQGALVGASTTNTGTIYVDPAGTTGTTLKGGIPLNPGDRQPIPQSTGAVTIYGPAGASIWGYGC